MQTKPKANSVVTHSVADRTITFTVRDGGTFNLNLETVSDAVLDRAMIHGLIQRISDRAAISRNTETGKPATPFEKFEAMRELSEHYASGSSDWSMRVAARPDGGLLFEALVTAYPDKGAERIREWLKSLDAKQKAQLLVSDKIRPFAEAIRAEAGKHVDVEELLNDL